MKLDLEEPPLTANPAVSTKNESARCEELENRVRQAERSREWLLEAFAAHIHRLSQPLTALHGTVELALMSEISPDECRSILEESLQDLERLRQTVTAMRDLAETERDFGPGGSPLPLMDVVGRTTEVASVLAEALGATVEIETRGDFNVFTRAARLERALHEVIRIALHRLGRAASLRLCFSSCSGFAYVTLSNASRTVVVPVSASSLASRIVARPDPDESGNWDWTAARRLVELTGGRFEVRGSADSEWALSVSIPTAASEDSC